MVGNHPISGKWANDISFIFIVLYLWVLLGFTWKSDQSSLTIILSLFPSVLGNAIFSQSIDGWRKMFYFVLFHGKICYIYVCVYIYIIGDLKLIIFNVLYKCLFHLLSSVCMFIYTILFISSLECILSVGGKWKCFIPTNYFFNHHFHSRSRENI